MSEKSAQDWVSDITDGSDDSDDSDDGDSGGTSLFEENFRQLAQSGDVEDMTLDTLESQVSKIDDPEILSLALEVDTRSGAEDIYKERVAELNSGEADEESDDESEQSPKTDGGSKGDTDAKSDPESDSLEESVESPSEDKESTVGSTEDSHSESDDLPDIDVASLAPDAVDRETAAEQSKPRTLLVWGPEGAGKSHLAHSAPAPICYIDTEGKADELAEKFDKRIHYFEATDYKQAKAAMEQSFDLLAEYLDAGVRGTIVVDSMTAMWEYAKVDWAKFKYQTEDLSEVNFQSELEGEKDWTKIKARHNASFRERILDSPYHVVFTSGQKEDYGEVFADGSTKLVPDGEKWNKYAVKDVVRLRRDDSGKTVADLRKASKTRYSFVGLEWPTWDSVYDAIDRISEAEQSSEEVDLSDWAFEVVDGQPIGDSPDGSDEEDDDE